MEIRQQFSENRQLKYSRYTFAQRITTEDLFFFILINAEYNLKKKNKKKIIENY